MDNRSQRLIARIVSLLATSTLAVALCLGSGCAPQTGDACITSTECGPGQVCDTTSPGGYCLEYDCVDNGCAEEAICVEFTQVSACMKRCDSDKDCRNRDGYVCRTDVGSVPFCYVPVTEEGSGEP